MPSSLRSAFLTALAWLAAAAVSAAWRFAVGDLAVPTVELDVGLALLLMHGRAAWPGLAAGAALAALLLPPSGEAGLWTRAAQALPPLATVAVASAALRRARAPRLTAPRELARFVVVCIAAALAGQGLAIALQASGPQPLLGTFADAFSLIAFTPAVLCWWAVPVADWRPRRLGLGIVVPALALLTSHLISRHVDTQQRLEGERLTAEATTAEAALHDRLQGALDALATVQSLLAVDPQMSQQTFELATRSWAGRHDLHALGAVQPLAADGVAGFEALLRRHGAPTPQVRAATGDGGVRPRSPDEAGFAIRLIAPWDRNAQVLGIDTYANPNVKPAIDRALATREPTATAPFPLRLDVAANLPGAAPVPGIVIYQPIAPAHAGDPPWLGFVTMRLDQVLPATPAAAGTDLLKCLFSDDGGTRRPLAHNGMQACAPAAPGANVLRRKVDFAGQTWGLALRSPRPPPSRADAQVVQALALSALAVVAVLLLSTTGHARLYERLAARARAAQADALAAQRARADFLDRVQHELRAPLNAMFGALQMLRRAGTGSGDTGQPWLQRVDQAGRHLRDMIDDLLDSSASQLRDLEVRDDVVELAPLVADSIDLACQTARPANWQVGTVPAEWRVHGDGRRIRQVLVNLLTNAAKYNRPGGGVRVGATARPDTLAVRVDDDGLGMTPEQLAMLFQPFNRLGREATGIEGKGLGLYLSRQLAQRMGAHLAVESAPGRGSTFTLTLRRAPDAGAARADAPPLKLFAFEDEPTAVAVLEAMASQRPGWTLEHRPHIAGALEALRRVQPDVLLLDEQLSDGDGSELLERLARDPALREVPVVLISGSPPSSAGAVAATVPKPWNLDELERAIEAAALRPAPAA